MQAYIVLALSAALIFGGLGARVTSALESTDELQAKAESGDAEAQYNLGVLYAEGQGGPRDYTEARAWYLKAAAQGLAEAQYGLGLLYAKGRGVPPDDVQAYMWLNLAAATEEKEWATYRDSVAEKMTAAQIAEGQRLAREWFAAHRPEVPTGSR